MAIIGGYLIILDVIMKMCCKQFPNLTSFHGSRAPWELNGVNLMRCKRDKL